MIKANKYEWGNKQLKNIVLMPWDVMREQYRNLFTSATNDVSRLYIRSMLTAIRYSLLILVLTSTM